MSPYTFKAVSLGLAVLFATSVHAQAVNTLVAPDTLPPVLNINTQVKTTLVNDEMQLSISVRQQGVSANDGNEFVAKMTSEAMTALKAAGIKLSALTTNQYPEYSNGKVVKSKWTTEGRFTAQATSTHIPTLINVVNKLAARHPDVYTLQSNMTISEASLEKAKQTLITDASVKFKQEAQSIATAMGYSSFKLKEISFQEGFGHVGYAAPRLMKAMASAEADVVAEPVATEGEASATLSGQVYLIK